MANSLWLTGQVWTDADGAFRVQDAPIAYTGTTVTLTVADLRTRIITATNTAAVGFTLPTGTLTDAGFTGLPVGGSFDWSVINLGSSSGAVTMNVGTDHTYVGSATVAIATSALFRTRKTAKNTFITYRVG